MSTLIAGAGRPIPARQGLLVSAGSLGDAALWLAAFLGGFVIREPAPYELYMAGLLVVWLACGLKLRPQFGPLIVMMMLFIAGGIASVPFARDLPTAIIYMAVSAFLAATAIFYAAILAERPERTRVIERAYIASATLSALIGIVGYFHLLPGSDFFTLYGRARGTFEDPNVFGPFLVLPAVLLIQRLLGSPFARNLSALMLLPILVLGVFLSFSRGAWAMLAIAALVLYLLQLVSERRPAARLRLVLIGVAGVVAVAGLLAVALSIESVADMFQQRAKLVQDYDGARLGRFARYSLGFGMVMEHPLGLGPLEFNKYFPEDEHNVYLKAFTTYGWLGGTTYLFLVVWTLAAFVPVLFKARPWTPFARCVFAVLLAHMIMSAIIDTDHWRHFYMLYGLAWGLIAADRMSLANRSVDRHARQTLRPAIEPDKRGAVGQ
ncbi:O-antigen ligase family protein [Polymorphum gilvum]|uniref:O-Antigen Polymerase family n=1 Tax=Polymorphum gilvum (strain LMG 25793 / CGMCC 1.9160 / SL003B-26A1) TaxID=991905 RepID=F2IWN3_POLGS|nr:O-antigen ligase family protein [Polymorphum gilvum]ADZ70358.1 O-Antigen Polymerase family [Polymorphum gilvum SL003B-26A1]